MDIYLPMGAILRKADQREEPERNGAGIPPLDAIQLAGKTPTKKKRPKDDGPSTCGGHHLSAKPRRGGGHVLDFGHGVEADHHDELSLIDHEAEMHKHSRRHRAFRESADQLEAAGHDTKVIQALRGRAEAHKRAAMHHKGEWEHRGGGREEDQVQHAPPGMDPRGEQQRPGGAVVGPPGARGGGIAAAIATRAQQANAGRTQGGPKLPGGRNLPVRKAAFPTLDRDGCAEVTVPIDVQMQKAVGSSIAPRPGHWIGAAPLTEGGGDGISVSQTVVQPNQKCLACARYNANRTLCEVGSYPDICGLLFQAIAGIDLSAAALSGGLGADPADAGAIASGTVIEDATKSRDPVVPRDMQERLARGRLSGAARVPGGHVAVIDDDWRRPGAGMTTFEGRLGGRE